MTGTNNLPAGPKMSRWLRVFKFIMQPVEYVEDFAKIYGDSFTIWTKRATHLVYFSAPQALEEVFTLNSKKAHTVPVLSSVLMVARESSCVVLTILSAARTGKDYSDEM